jgi:hypothetical protein
MSIDEVNNIFKLVGELDMSRMEIQDQMRMSLAFCEFAETMKPIVMKYCNDLPEKSTYLFKM